LAKKTDEERKRTLFVANGGMSQSVNVVSERLVWGSSSFASTSQARSAI